MKIPSMNSEKSFLLILSLVLLFVFSANTYVNYCDESDPECSHRSEGKSESKKVACLDHNCCSHSHNVISSASDTNLSFSFDLKEIYFITHNYSPDKFKASPLLEPPSIS